MHTVNHNTPALNNTGDFVTLSTLSTFSYVPYKSLNYDSVFDLTCMLCLLVCYFKGFSLTAETYNKKMQPHRAPFLLVVFLHFSAFFSDSFKMDLLWLKLLPLFHRLPEHSSPFSSQRIRTQGEYRPNPSTAVLLLYFLYTQTTFIHPCHPHFDLHAHSTQLQAFLQQRQALLYF